jgi:hypothetical protein
MVVGLVPLLEEVRGLLLDEVAVYQLRGKLLLKGGVAGRGLGVMLGLGRKGSAGFLWLLLLFESRNFLQF